jgi:hypothetical protein
LPLEFLSMHQSPYFPTSYGASGEALAPGFYVGPGDWAYNVESPEKIRVLWDPTGKDKDTAGPFTLRYLDPGRATAAYEELKTKGLWFPNELLAIRYARGIFPSDVPPTGIAGAASLPTSAKPVAGTPAKKGAPGAPAKTGGKRREVKPATTSPWVYVGVGAGALALLGLIIYAVRKD